MKKYILDTSALIVDPQTWKSFKNAEVIIPIAVLNELDKLKKQPGEVGKSARVCIRLLDDISNSGDINTGVKLEDDTMLKIDASYNNMSDPNYQGFGDPTYGDTQILACLYTHYLLDKNTILVSNDINLRIKAKSRGIEAISHVREGKVSSDLYSGCQIIHNEAAGIELVTTGKLNVDDHDLNLYPNECVLFKGDDGENIIMGRKVSDNEIKTLNKCYPWSLSSRNKEQAFAIELIMDTGIDLVTLTGGAGSGKSLVAIASALELVLHKKKYDKLIIYRPIQSVGNEIGYLPGLLEEKLAPWFQPIMDSFEVLFNKSHYDWKKDVEMYQKKGKIEFGAITYIRGRSIPNAIILVDESQNLNKEEIKTILTRAGEGTKIILTGDLDQIDNNGLDAINNGLTYTIEKFKDSPLAGHITFIQGERSRLATEAAEIL